MSCNCNGCGQPERLCRCPKGKGEAPKRAYIAECTDCDPCRPCKSMVKICSFVTPTLTEGQRFRNSFVYNQEDDSVYYISDDGTPTRFGSSPMFINAFNPDDRKIPRQVVFDFMNNKAYVYDPEGEYKVINLGQEEKKLHIYVPNYLRPATTTGFGGDVVALSHSALYETPEIVVKDNDGNVITAEEFGALGDKLLGYTFVVHTPAIEDGVGGSWYSIPEQTAVLRPSMFSDDIGMQEVAYTSAHITGGNQIGGYGIYGSFWGIAVCEAPGITGKFYTSVFSVRGTITGDSE